MLINGVEYELKEVQNHKNDGKRSWQFILDGEVVYFTVRNLYRNELMYLLRGNWDTGFADDEVSNIWFTDRSGKLEVLDNKELYY